MILNKKNFSKIVLSLAIITIMGILAIDMFLPSVPDIAKYYNANISTTQLSISIYIFSIGIGQLIFGPLSDSFGRRKILIPGIIGFIITTLIITISPSIYIFLFSRLLQGLFVSMTLVVVMSIVRDISRNTVATYIFAIIITIEALVPILSPALGGYIETHFYWQMIFYVIAIFSIIVLFNTLFNIQESLPVKKRKNFNLKEICKTYKQILLDKKFLFPCIGLSLSFSYIFSYIAASPFLFVNTFKMSPSKYGIVFGIIGVFLIIGSSSCSILIKKFTAIKTIYFSLTIPLILFTVSALITLLTSNILFFLTISIFALTMITIGMVETIFTSATMASQTKNYGYTSALMGSISLVVPSLFGSISGYIVEYSIGLWFIYIVALLALIIIITMLWTRKK